MSSNRSIRWGFAIAMVVTGVIAASGAAVAQTENVERFTATTVDIQPQGEALRINVLRWLSEADRGEVLSHLRGTDAAEDSPTVGVIWPSSSGLGYALIYTHRVAAQDGGEHITLVTRRPIGLPGREPWQATGGTRSKTADDFTVVELRLDSRRNGEGKMSLATEITFDENANTVSLESYDAAPVLLEDVKRQPERYRSRQD